MIEVASNDVLSEPYPPVTVPFSAKRLQQQIALSEFRKYPQIEAPLTHRFQDGVYMREILMPTGSIIVGHIHKTRHQNIVLSGKAMVSMNGGPCKVVRAGDVFESEPGVQKWLYIEDECRWMTVHANPSNSQNIASLEEQLLELSPEFLAEKGDLTIDEARLAYSQNHMKEISL